MFRSGHGRLVSWALVGIALLAGCDRPLPVESELEIEPGVSPGTFEAEAGRRTGGGFERLEGPATFEIRRDSGGTAVLMMRLLSTFAGADTSTIDLAIARGRVLDAATYAVGAYGDAATDFSQHFVLHYRSPFLAEDAFHSESGTLVLAEADDTHLVGRFDVTAYTKLQTGADTFVRRRIRVTGTFNAVRGTTGIDPDELFREKTSNEQQGSRPVDALPRLRIPHY